MKKLSDLLELPIKVDVSSLTDNERGDLQRELFSVGVEWIDGKQEVILLYAEQYYIGVSSKLTQSSDSHYFRCCKQKEISIQELKEKISMCKQFTKANLKTGMIIQFMNGEIGQVLLNTDRGDIVTGDDWFPLDNRTDESMFGSAGGLNQVKSIFQPKSNKYFNFIEAKRLIERGGCYEYNTIWKREEKSQNQLEIEKIQAEMDTLKQRLEELKGEV